MQDFLLDNDNDLLIANGDFVIARSDEQHQILLLVMDKGQLKENPEKTLGLENYINENEITEMLFAVTQIFEADGMAVTNLEFNKETGELNYDAKYRS